MADEPYSELLRAVGDLIGEPDPARLQRTWGIERYNRVTSEMHNVVAEYIDADDPATLRAHWCATLGSENGEALFEAVTAHVWRQFPHVLHRLLKLWERDSAPRLTNS